MLRCVFYFTHLECFTLQNINLILCIFTGMVIKITESQNRRLILKENNCSSVFQKKLNGVWLKNIFRPVIDKILTPYRKKWNGDEDKYRKILGLIGIKGDDVDKILDINFVYRPDGSWSRINKLNTNYSDLSVLITDILNDKGSDLCELSKRLDNNDKLFLSELSNEMKSNPEFYFKNYLSSNEDKYVVNNIKNTLVGDDAENKVVDFFVKKLKWDLIYQSVEGSPIDTKLGIDLIMENNYGFIKKIQVKSVGTIKLVDKTPCEEMGTFQNKKIGGGYSVYSRNGVSINPDNVDYVAYVNNDKIIVCKKYMPVTVINNKCVDEPINDFPSSRRGSFFVDHESVVFKNFYIKPKI
jgi:hypothetical protein